MSQLKADEAFFKLAASLIEQQKVEANDLQQKRCEQRQDYRCVQLMAPIYSEMPNASDFRLVQCLDLSPSGFSFLSPTKPDYRRIVIGLGKLPFIFFEAQVRYVQSLESADVVSFKVGCRLLSRVEK